MCNIGLVASGARGLLGETLPVQVMVLGADESNWVVMTVSLYVARHIRCLVSKVVYKNESQCDCLEKKSGHIVR